MRGLVSLEIGASWLQQARHFLGLSGREGHVRTCKREGFNHFLFLPVLVLRHGWDR